MKKSKVLFKVFIGVVIVIVVLLVLNSIPTWNLKTKVMKRLEGNRVTVFYETEMEAAEDILKLTDTNAKALEERMGFTSKQDLKVYIYDHQRTMQTKKYGLIAPLLGLDWYIGDNIGTNVIVTSPANPGKAHNYDSIRNAVLHEMVHAYNSVLNPHTQLWLKEGIALYLTNGKPFHKSLLDYIDIPSYSDIQTKNPIKFANIGGYDLAHTYIKYLDVTYGWEKVLELIKIKDYRKVFGVSEEEIYSQWVGYITNYIY